jgi:uncharacterized membrane protein HdeD (DUF308 family)
MLFLAIYFLAWGICNLLDARCFRLARYRSLEAGARKTLRRSAGICLLLVGILFLADFLLVRYVPAFPCGYLFLCNCVLCIPILVCLLRQNRKYFGQYILF